MSQKILHINCHPLFSETSHSTVQLSNHGLKTLSGIPHLEVEVLNLYDKNLNLPQVDKAMLSAWTKDISICNDEERNILETQSSLIDQWIKADFIFIYSPLHNFNVTSRFKEYVDNILIAGRTFKYTVNGSVGLLNDSKKVVYIQSSGGAYEEDIKYVNADIAPHYVRTILSIMGINKMHLIRVQGLDLSINSRNGLIEKGKAEVSEYINRNLLELASINV